MAFSRSLLKSSGLLVVGLLLAGCKKESEAPLLPAEQGRKVYMSNCIACHNVNPKVDGGLGPAIWGSSQELLQARVVKGSYPDGYKPKRETKMMTTFPHLQKDIDALHAFLQTE